MDHGIENFQILKIENAAQHVAVIGDESPFLVVQINGAAQFIMGGQDIVHIGDVDAENAEDIFYDIFNGDYYRAEHRHEHAQDGGNGKGHPVRIGNGIGLGHDFAKDQHKHGHRHGCDDGAAVAEGLDEDCRGKGRG